MTVEIIPVSGIGEVGAGDDLATLILGALEREDVALRNGDILVVTHKVVSKAEGALVAAADAEARRAIIEREAVRIIRRRGDLLIAETRHGLVCANAGVDASNVPDGWVALLPADPDRSAHRLRAQLGKATGTVLAVVITDTFGRPWRRGLTDVAIGVSGMEPIADHRGSRDSFGRTLEVTEVALADEVAAAAELVMGKTRSIPAAVVRGVPWIPADGTAGELVRPPGEDLFR